MIAQSCHKYHILRAKFITKIMTLLPAGVNCEKSVNLCSPSTLHLKSTLNIVSLSIAVKYLQIHCLCVFVLQLISICGLTPKFGCTVASRNSGISRYSGQKLDDRIFIK